jgi:membrane protein required for colicin V production
MISAPIDIAFVILIVILTVRAGLRGLVEEISGIAWLILGLIFSFAFFRQGAVFIRDRFQMNIRYVPEILSFVILFLIVFIVVKIITAILKDIIDRVSLTGIDRFLGVLFGIIEGIVVIALILFIMDIQPLFDKNSVLENSLFNHILGGSVESVQDMMTSGKAE